MLYQNYLAVRSLSLGAGDTWQPRNDGLFFLFISRGGGDYFDAALSRRVQKGDVLVLRQGPKRNRIVAKKSGMVFLCFSLLLEQLFPLFDVCELSLLEDVVEGFGSFRIYRTPAAPALKCQRLLQHLSQEPSLEQRAQVLAIVASILTEEFKTARTRRPGFLRADEHMKQVFDKLTEREFLDLSVPELASRFGCSRRHLSRLFHRYFGSSIAEFRTELRLIKVASLLRNPNIKIINVAEQCGFNHLGHFNACFKRRFGLSPGRWRKQMPGGMQRTGEKLGQNTGTIIEHWLPYCAKPQSGQAPAPLPFQFQEKRDSQNSANSHNVPQQVLVVEQANPAPKKSFELIGSLKY